MAETLNLNTTFQAIVAAAKDRKFLTYGDIAKAQNLEWSKVRYAMNSHLETLLEICAANEWPLLTAIVVNQGGLKSGSMGDSAMDGFVAAAKRCGRVVTSPADFVQTEQAATFEWAKSAPAILPIGNVASPAPKVAAGPRFVQYFPYVLDLLRAHGGSAEPRDVYAKLRKMTPVGDDELIAKTKGGQSKFENKVGWARFYLGRVDEFRFEENSLFPS